jgi:hypothetical protein
MEVQRPIPERPLRTGDSKIRARTSAWRRNNAPPRPLSLRAARVRPDIMSGAAASAHPGQPTAVGPARAPSPGNRRPRLEGPGRENLAAGSAVAGGKCEAYAAAPIGQARPRSVAPAELPAAAGEAFTEMHLKGALARAERAGKAPAHLESVLKLCSLASLKRPRRSAAPPDGHSRPTRVQAASRGAMASRQEVNLRGAAARESGPSEARRWPEGSRPKRGRRLVPGRTSVGAASHPRALLALPPRVWLVI